jgi:hypothetical protein
MRLRFMDFNSASEIGHRWPLRMESPGASVSQVSVDLVREPR